MRGWVGIRALGVAALVSLLPGTCGAYSVQTHEQLVDLAWKGSIVPLLRSRFPQITEAQLREAHSYAYGGCAVQDLGYYPFGKPFFSDLTHYVRPADFVLALVQDSKTPDELAFAVGALSHFLGDVQGHSIAVNPAVGVEFPKLAAKFGRVVTYEDNPHAHVRTEFAFDINEISKRRFAPLKYLDHVGLKVAVPLLRRAFEETYGLKLEEVLGEHSERTALPGYRFSVRSFLPRIAYAETLLHRGSMPADTPGPELEQMERELKQSAVDNGWEVYRRRAGIGTYTLAGIIYVLPKFGTLSLLAIKGPDAATEDLYVKSVNQTTDVLRRILLTIRTEEAAQQRTLVNRDLDTGQRIQPGTYRLTDQTYATLLGRLTKRQDGGLGRKIPAGLESDVDQYYSDADAPISTKKDPKAWAKVQTELVAMKQMPVIPEP
jgi:hypothetical protein